MTTATTARVRLRHALDLGRAHATSWRSRRSGDGVPAARFLVNSLPKSGTNLLAKAVAGMPGLSHVNASIMRQVDEMLLPRAGERTVDVGVDGPGTASYARVRDMLKSLPPGAFTLTHVPHSPALAQLLAELDVRMVVIIRDPRAVAVSSAEWISTRPRHYMHPYYVTLNPAERITSSLEGVPADVCGIELRDIRTRLRSVLRWADEPFAMLTRFEDLIGASGGGSHETQFAELQRIAVHVGSPCTADDLRRIGDGLFGGTHTFRSGQVGRWREAFDDEHIAASRRLLTDQLLALGYESDADWTGSAP